MLDAFFWKVFEETGDIDAYLGIREYRLQQSQHAMEKYSVEGIELEEGRTEKEEGDVMN
ncbi:MAG: YqzL family protein [Epulopiscium sp.]|nr:YqzL family protein [Candidatus Epulonipiscium sp.]